MEIQVRTKCDTCKGERVVQSSEWAEFWILPNANKMTPDEVWAWFKEKGYIYSSNNSKGLYGEPFENFPPEKTPCPDCEGIGTITEWMPITYVLALCPGAPKVQVAP